MTRVLVLCALLALTACGGGVLPQAQPTPQPIQVVPGPRYSAGPIQ